jgi:asparagine synthase (glutamine-hydrolysing)
MCGIVGVYKFHPEDPVDPRLLESMCNSICHRGPDDEGYLVNGNVGLGMRRLSIVGVTTGHQPMANEDKTCWIVFNGEIYNYPELKKMLVLRGHQFRTASDTECILHLYEDHGYQCLDYLRGMFAFAIWDSRDNSLFVARDRLGIKPLHYFQDDHQLVLGSEIKSILLTPGFERSINFTAMDAFFQYTYIPAPMTIFRDIFKLEPGHYLVCRGKDVSVRQYWDLRFQPDYGKPELRFQEECEALLDETVRIHLMTEVSMGAFLSGGVDSSLIVAMMSRHLETPVKTITMGFGGQTGEYLDERAYARELAARCHCDQEEHEVVPDVDRILDSIVTSFDEPFADDSVIPSYHICRLARHKVTVAMTGLGGDELFGGYERYLGLKLNSLYAKIPRWLRNGAFSPLIQSWPDSSRDGEFSGRLKRFDRAAGMNAGQVYSSYLASLSDEHHRQLYQQDVYAQINSELVQGLATRFFEADNAEHPLDKAFYQDLKMYLPDDILALSDRLGMRHSIELRVPFVDHRVVEFCATIPANLKIRGWKKKHLLRKIARPYLPASILDHPKQGFSSPMTSWLRTDLKQLVLDGLSEETIKRGHILDCTFVNRTLNEHMVRKENHYKLIFSLLIFQRWYETYRPSW